MKDSRFKIIEWTMEDEGAQTLPQDTALGTWLKVESRSRHLRQLKLPLWLFVVCMFVSNTVT